MLKLKKGDKVKYLYDFPYILGNGQYVDNFKELLISSDVLVQSKYFNKIEEIKKEEPKKEEVKKSEPKKEETDKEVVNEKEKTKK